MAEHIITTATFGQKKEGDKEEEPIIIAQRFLNIFRQLHIFSQEKKDEFNSLLLGQSKEVRKSLKTLPGGTVLLEYIEELEQGKSDKSDDDSDEVLPDFTENRGENITEKKAFDSNVVVPAAPGGTFDSSNFAKVLANSLAQSNAQIIKELQNNRPAASTSRGSTAEQVKLVADDTFTTTISKALSEAITASEKKRQEDNKVIAQSFLELQENLNKMIEQNNQLKIISNSDAPAEAASAFQLKNVVDDLVKAQSKFLKETTQSQKEELSAIISLAIKESINLSTQSLIENFKQMEDDGPTPITYAASSPKKQVILDNVTEALKAQGREFSSIIASTLKESQQNSAQTIVQTIESLKGASATVDGEQLTVKDIIKMQAELFREITQSQNKEFSAIVSSALKESQQQSTQTIINALSQMRNFKGGATQIVDQSTIDTNENATGDAESLKPAVVISPEKNYDVTAENIENDNPIEPKKKKKKKKKNHDEIFSSSDKVQNSKASILQKSLQPNKTIVTALPEMPAIQDVPVDISSDWGFGAEKVVEENQAAKSSEISVASEVASNESAALQEKLVDETPAEAQDFGTEGKDWEWEYEEVSDDESANNGNIEGEEGKDWEWEYEEISDEDQSAEADNDNIIIPEQADELSKVTASNFEVILVGMEDDWQRDPYFDGINSVG